MSTKSFINRMGQTGVVLAAAGLAVLLGSGIASAHVTARVIGEASEKGGFTKITFRVPNEDPTAGTVKVEVRFPADHPIGSLRTQVQPGWTGVVTKAKLPAPVTTSKGVEGTEAVSTVTWTADPGVKIGAGQFAEFEVAGGALPDNTDTLVLPAIQTYDNGKVVNWTDAPPAAGAEEPEHPAPTITLTAPTAGGDEHNMAPAANQPVANAANQSSTAAAPASTDKTARWLGGIGLVVGALGLGFGLGATMRARRTVAKAGDGS